MKQVAIFDDFYTDSQDLEHAVNEWIREENVNVLNIDVKTYISAFNDEVCADGQEQTSNCIVWYAIVTYTE